MKTNMRNSKKSYIELRDKIIKSLNKNTVRTSPNVLTNEMTNIFEEVLHHSDIDNKQNIIMLESTVRIPSFLKDLYKLFNINIKNV